MSVPAKPGLLQYLHAILNIFQSFIILIVLAAIALAGAIIFLGRLQNFIFEKIYARAARMVLRVNGVRLAVHTLQPVDRSVVYIINHSSTLDMFIIASLALPRTRYVAKYEFLYNPIFLVLGKASGQIFVKRQDREKAVSALHKSYARIRKKNYSLLVAPEGTRKHEGLIGPFKKGAFRIALDLQYPIVPIHIKGARELCPGRSLFVHSGTVNVQFHPPIETSSWSLDSLDKHIQSLRDQYVDWETTSPE
ncbi:MAG: lysophospholipid acyltransferase family protein [bacterium]